MTNSGQSGKMENVTAAFSALYWAESTWIMHTDNNNNNNNNKNGSKTKACIIGLEEPTRHTLLSEFMLHAIKQHYPPTYLMFSTSSSSSVTTRDKK